MTRQVGRVGPDVVGSPIADAEFRAGWRLLLGSAIGIGVGIIALPGPAVGIFMRQWQAEFGWTRTQISLGPTILILTLALVAPMLGWVADRLRARLVVAVSLTALALGLALFSRLNGNLALYYMGFAALAVAAGGTSTVVYAKLLTSAFCRHRGLALGLAMMGNGATGILLPLLMVPFAAAAGWRVGYLVLAGLVLAAMPLVVVLIGPQSRTRAAAAGERPRDPQTLFGNRTFLILAICFALIPFAVSGLHLHFVAYLNDIGMNPAEAGAVAGTAGASLALARIATGFLIDRLFAPYVAAAMMGGSGIALAALGLWGAPAALLGAVAIGVSIGAELDLIGYLVARYFHSAHFGRIYGLLYSSVLVGSAASPVAYGLVADRSGSYGHALFAASALLAMASMLFLALPRFDRDGAEPL